MEILTKTGSVVSIDSDQVITLVRGFYGFEKFCSFALLDSEQPPFIRIQSLEEPRLGFIAIDPFLFRPDYEIDIDDVFLQPLEITRPTDALVFALVTIPTTGEPITANLQGPLIINKVNKKAVQAIVGGEKWGTKHDIVAECAKARTHSC